MSAALRQWTLHRSRLSVSHDARDRDPDRTVRLEGIAERGQAEPKERSVPNEKAASRLPRPSSARRTARTSPGG